MVIERRYRLRIRKGKKVEVKNINYKDLIKNILKDSLIITKAPGAAFLFGEHAVVKGQPALYLPLPLYIYLGLQNNNCKETPCVHIENFYYQNPSANISFDTERKIISFHLKGLKPKEKRRLSTIIKRALKDAGYNSISISLEIFSEIPIKCGVNSSGALSAALSLAIHVITGDISREDLKNWRNDILKNNLIELKNDKKFKKVLRVAYIIDKRIQGATSGIGPFASLVGSPTGVPIIYQRYVPVEKYPGFTYVDDKLLDSSIEMYDKFYALYSLGETQRKGINTKFWKQPEETKSGSFVAIIYSGNVSNTKRAFTLYNNHLEKVTQMISNLPSLVSEFEGIPDKILENEKEYYLVSPLRTLLNDISKNIAKKYIESRFIGILGGYSLAGIGYVQELSSQDKTRPTSKQDITEETAEHIAYFMNEYHNVLHALGLSSSGMNKLRTKILSSISSEDESHLGIKVTGSGPGGDMIVYGWMDLDTKDEILSGQKTHFDSAKYLELINEEEEKVWAEGATIILYNSKDNSKPKHILNGPYQPKER